MAKIYKRSDRIAIKVDDVTIKIAPLSLDQKTEAQQLMAEGRFNKDYSKLMKGVILLIKSSLKEVHGLENADGTPYKLEFENDLLSDQCVDDLFNIQLHKKLVLICSSLVSTFPSEFTDEAGNPLEGVEILPTQAAPTDPN